MNKINSNLITEAVYNLCIQANVLYEQKLYNLMLTKLESDKENQTKYINILKNIEIAKENKRPLCQDTGQVIVFLEIGQDVHITDGNLNKAINNAVARAYIENYYRKSTVKNAIFNRTNNNDNTPAIIYSEIVSGKSIKIAVLIKGAGSENYSKIKMFNPSDTEENIIDFIKDVVITAGEKSCPPLVLGIGIGGTMDKAAILSKKAFICEDNTEEENEFINKIKFALDYPEKNSFDKKHNHKNCDYRNNLLDIKLQTTSTHIACLPVAITVNCHSTRHASCKIENNTIKYNNTKYETKKLDRQNKNLERISTSEIKKIISQEAGKEFLLSGEIYTARDAAHIKLYEEYNETGKTIINLSNKIIFYAGPCPAAPDEAIGPIGPTTSTRMDKYTEFIYSNGVLATIGKGERTQETNDIIKKYNRKYLTVQGGIAALISRCVKKSTIIAYEELETEAIRRLEIEDLPVKVVI